MNWGEGLSRHEFSRQAGVKPLGKSSEIPREKTRLPGYSPGLVINADGSDSRLKGRLADSRGAPPGPLRVSGAGPIRGAQDRGSLPASL